MDVYIYPYLLAHLVIFVCVEITGIFIQILHNPQNFLQLWTANIKTLLIIGNRKIICYFAHMFLPGRWGFLSRQVSVN